MKRTQRNFVVEFKSSRRRPTAQANSIWGNTDFKALALEVETMSPQLFKAASPVEDTPAPSIDTPREPRILHPIAQGHDGASMLAREADAPADILAEHESVRDDAPTNTVEAVAEVSASSIPRPRNARRAIRKRGTALREVNAGKKDSAPATTDLTPVSFEELDLLEAENRRLKALMAAKLRAENALLAKMIQRFGII